MNDKAVDEAARAGWGTPNPAGRSTPMGSITGAPITDGPISGWHSQTMTVGGTATATGVLLVLVLVTATVGWMMTSVGDSKALPLALGAMIFGFVLAIVLRFKPTLAKVLAPSTRSRKVSSSASSRGSTTLSTRASSCRPSAPRSPCSS